MHAGLIKLVRVKRANCASADASASQDWVIKVSSGRMAQKVIRSDDSQGPFQKFLVNCLFRGSFESNRLELNIFSTILTIFWSPLMVVGVERSVAACFSSPPLR